MAAEWLGAPLPSWSCQHPGWALQSRKNNLSTEQWQQHHCLWNDNLLQVAASSNISTTKALSWTICCHVDNLVGLPKPFIRVECISTLASPPAEQKGNLKKGPSFIIVDSWAGVWAENIYIFFLEKNKDPEDGECLLSSKLLGEDNPSSSFLSSCLSRWQKGNCIVLASLPLDLITWWHLELFAVELGLACLCGLLGRDLQNRTFLPCPGRYRSSKGHWLWSSQPSRWVLCGDLGHRNSAPWPPPVCSTTWSHV